MAEKSGPARKAARDGPARVPKLLGYAAFVWGFLFAGAHVYWGFGGSLLLGETSVGSAEVLFGRDPWTYVTGWAILSLLFFFAGLFPLALVWSGGRRIGRSAAQTCAAFLGYVGMVSLALFGLAARETGIVVFGCGVCVLGGIVALARPRGRPISGWTVLVATWGLGLAMTFYGCGYVVAAAGAAGSELFLVYLITGGASWLVGGILFVGTAWLASRGRPHDNRHVRQYGGDPRAQAETTDASGEGRDGRLYVLAVGAQIVGTSRNQREG